MQLPRMISWTFMLTLAALIGVSISHAAEEKPADSKSTFEDVKKESRDLLETLRSFSVEQRDEAVAQTKDALDDLDMKIEDLEERLAADWDTMDKKAREKARETLRALRKQRTKAAEWYGSMKNSSKEAWDNMKKGFSDAYKSLREAWEESEKEFGIDDEPSEKNKGTAL